MHGRWGGEQVLRAQECTTAGTGQLSRLVPLNPRSTHCYRVQGRCQQGEEGRQVAPQALAAAGSRQAGSRQAGSRQAGSRQAGSRQAGSRQAGCRQEGSRQAGGRGALPLEQAPSLGCLALAQAPALGCLARGQAPVLGRRARGRAQGQVQGQSWEPRKARGRGRGRKTQQELARGLARARGLGLALGRGPGPARALLGQVEKEGWEAEGGRAAGRQRSCCRCRPAAGWCPPEAGQTSSSQTHWILPPAPSQSPGKSRS
jgi:hypothetical protein